MGGARGTVDAHGEVEGRQGLQVEVQGQHGGRDEVHRLLGLAEAAHAPGAHVVVGGEGLGDVDQVHRQQEVQPVQPGQAGRVVLDGGGVVGPRDEGARPAQHAGVVVGVLRLEATGEGGRGGGGQQQRGDLQAHGLLPAVKAAR